MEKSYKARSIAYELLVRVVIKKAYPDLVLNQFFSKNKNIKSNDIKLITEIVYGTIRWKEKLRYVLNSFLKHKIKSKKVELLLLTGIYQILYLDSIPDHASINETVNIVKRKFDNKIKNLANAVLREVSRNKKSLDFPDRTNLSKYLSINYSYPGWLVDKWIDGYGAEITEDICINLNKHSKTAIRVKKKIIDREKFSELIADHNPSNTSLSNVGIYIDDQYGLLNSRYYKQGYFCIQDESSQIVSMIVDPKQGETILDACSAPGTKSNHLAEIMNNKGRIVSCDINSDRLNLVQNDAKRLGNTIIETVCSDARDISFSKDIRFDRILVDAPCSGLGTIKNNPDIKWNKNPEDIGRLSSIQLDILNNVSWYLKDGGTLVYSVCTLMREENEQVCEYFLEQNTYFRIDSSIGTKNEKINRLLDRNGYFSSLSQLDKMDGFFIAKFQKN
ncbi:MAG: 16S rRNA (cytosine(967)-C(5))-methyltransferase RsmB [Candidatus Dadabacteria bacterium]|nr:16S rRNA (cytosine(967)-C(5))-methyltransferase RsmB [Candidatus Dadabacteria bacterium]NIS07833.1 16S rRNA (cytosine(967)-C(5))-methyltransferase RsmB [Candidatus Dadabacteria bacterium]NIV42787.1 16S rRNA (cytosine(967)-C(5))-methyltransferase RsmB [Candidatus Dadabacteria bacterium]NIX14852.1 16S rRNA (cytosine(967)-C(5))-methyltransferase RsmB [Candidatus Dadabacteria bacterium]NIY21452.1 16S rRNA (cytosine(967)-C(5))-methyltransferase RsmB [Candidatus Dadabacteria bacterium]